MSQKNKSAKSIQFQHYTLIAKLGEGGMGKVFLAKDKKLSRYVAIKLLPKDLRRDDDLWQRFCQEAKITAQLDHPNIVQVYDVGQGPYGPFIVMQFIRGKSLRSLLAEKGVLDLKEALQITLQIAEALEFAHSKKVLHRDIKPDNIMIDERGQVKVMDFGLAKSVQKNKGLTKTGSYLGTPEYSSPEQCESLAIDQRSDLYSLGVVLYEMLTGNRPHRADTPLQLLRKIVDEPPCPIEKFRPDLPDPVMGLVEKLLAKRPEDRYSSATELIQDLKYLLHQLEDEEFDLAPPPTQLASRKTRTTKSTPSTKLLAGTIILCLGVILLVGIWKYLSSAEKTSSTTENSLSQEPPSTSDSQTTERPKAPKVYRIALLGVRSYRGKKSPWAELFYDILQAKLLESGKVTFLTLPYKLQKTLQELSSIQLQNLSPTLLEQLAEYDVHYLLESRINQQGSNLFLAAKMYGVNFPFFMATQQGPEEVVFQLSEDLAKKLNFMLSKRPLPLEGKNTPSQKDDLSPQGFVRSLPRLDTSKLVKWEVKEKEQAKKARVQPEEEWLCKRKRAPKELLDKLCNMLTETAKDTPIKPKVYLQLEKIFIGGKKKSPHPPFEREQGTRETSPPGSSSTPPESRAPQSTPSRAPKALRQMLQQRLLLSSLQLRLQLVVQIYRLLLEKQSKKAQLIWKLYQSRVQNFPIWQKKYLHKASVVHRSLYRKILEYENKVKKLLKIER